jgi:hypothetical protein
MKLYILYSDRGDEAKVVAGDAIDAVSAITRDDIFCCMPDYLGGEKVSTIDGNGEIKQYLVRAA